MKWLREFIKTKPELRNRKEANNKYRIKALAIERILERRVIDNVIEVEVSRLGKIERVQKRIPEEDIIYISCRECEKEFGYYKIRKSPRKFCSSKCASNHRYKSKMNKLRKNIEKS